MKPIFVILFRYYLDQTSLDQNIFWTKLAKSNLQNQAKPTKPIKMNLPGQAKPTKPYLPNQTCQTNLPTKSSLTYQAYWTKPKLLVKAVNAWARSAFGNVLPVISVFLPPPGFSSVPLGLTHSGAEKL